MVLQIKNAWETRAGEFRFAPRTILLLPVNQVGHRLRDGGGIGLGASKQPDQSPSGLRSGAGALGLGGSRGVAQQRLAKTAVRCWNAAQPAHGSLAIFASGERHGLARARDATASVNR